MGWLLGTPPGPHSEDVFRRWHELVACLPDASLVGGHRCTGLRGAAVPGGPPAGSWWQRFGECPARSRRAAGSPLGPSLRCPLGLAATGPALGRTFSQAAPVRSAGSRRGLGSALHTDGSARDATDALACRAARADVCEDGGSWRTAAAACPGVQRAMWAEWAAEATAGAALVVSDCTPVCGGMAAMRRGDRSLLWGSLGGRCRGAPGGAVGPRPP